MNHSINLLQFIQNSPSSFHVCENLADMLKNAGFTALCEAENTTPKPGKGYFFRRNSSSIIAFRMPAEAPRGYMICASHSDSPSLYVKDNAEIESPMYIRINAERYGGLIQQAWFDRPLSVAGRLFVRTENGMKTVLVNVDRNLLLIPSLAPHMGKINEINAAVDLVPLYGDSSAKGTFYQTIADAAGVNRDDILSCDLFLYNRQEGYIWGPNDEFLSSPKLDDLQCAYASMAAFLEGETITSTVPVCAVFDNEEVGSGTKQGAASTFLSDTLRRIILSAGGSECDYMAAIANSMMVSADNAHAVHPNHPEYADATHKPQMNHGIVIKHNAAQRYTTDAISAALFEQICKTADVPVQHFYNRSDLPGGSTLGNIANTKVSLNTVDIGLPQLAMHSPFETAGTKDTEYLINALKVFYRTKLTVSFDGSYVIS